jgi:hypothetical protein
MALATPWRTADSRLRTPVLPLTDPWLDSKLIGLSCSIFWTDVWRTYLGEFGQRKEADAAGAQAAVA